MRKPQIKGNALGRLLTHEGFDSIGRLVLAEKFGGETGVTFHEKTITSWWGSRRHNLLGVLRNTGERKHLWTGPRGGVAKEKKERSGKSAEMTAVE